MPIYEYKCKTCGATFDVQQSVESRDNETPCPICNSKDTERVISQFNSASSCGSGRPSGPFS